MKFFAVILALGLGSQGALAKVYEIKCSAPDLAAMHKFSAQGLIESTDDGKFQGQLEATLQEPGYQGAITQIATHKIEGQFKVIPAGDLMAEEVLTATAKATDLAKQSYSFMFDIGISASSKAVVNQKQYKSTCSLKLSSN